MKKQKLKNKLKIIKKDKKSITKGNSGGITKPQKKVTTYRYRFELQAEEKVLFVGEGNFSFSLSLALRFNRADNMVCTAFDSAEVVKTKYPESAEIIDTLLDLEADVRYQVDATQLESAFKNRRFSKIVFNFPHVGLGIKDQDENVLANQKLLVSFFNSAKLLLEQVQVGDLHDGEIVVSMKSGIPYDLWNIKQLAKECDLRLLRSMVFEPSDFPGYCHRRTIGYDAEISAPDNTEITKKPARMYIFGKN
jgi:25S rRNA (uracil2634-N3)-methyltransferase